MAKKLIIIFLISLSTLLISCCPEEKSLSNYGYSNIIINNLYPLTSADIIETFKLQVVPNNNEDYKNVITKKYTLKEMLELREQFYSKNAEISYNDFKDRFPAECARETKAGYYIIYLTKEGHRVFVFLTKNTYIYDFLVYRNFNNLEDFDFIQLNQSTLKKVSEMEYNYFLPPTSVQNSRTYIIKEGRLIIVCIKSIKSLQEDDYVIRKVIFQSNDEIENIYDDTPYILPIDKQ